MREIGKQDRDVGDLGRYCCTMFFQYIGKLAASLDQTKCSSSSAASTESAVATFRTVWNCSQSRARRNSSKVLTNSGVSLFSRVLILNSSCHYANSGSSHSDGWQDSRGTFDKVFP